MKKSRFESLDFVKFVLAVMIIFHHFQQNMKVHFERIPNFFGGNVEFGLCVEFFFIISGFLMAVTFEERSKYSFKQFMVPKVIRIYPMVIITVIAQVIFLSAGKITMGYWIEKPELWNVLTSVLLIYSGGPVGDVEKGINNPTWYLCVLILCYALAWTIAKICEKFNIKKINAYIAIVLIALGGYTFNINIPFLNFDSERGYSAFFWGMIIYEIYKGVREKTVMTISALVLAIIAGAILLDPTLVLYNQRGTYTYLLFPAVMLLFLSLEGKIDKNGKLSGFSKWLGGISFEMYIWHFPIIAFLRVINDITGRSLLMSAAGMCIFAAGIIVWSVIMYKCVEMPITKRLKQKYQG